MTIYIQSIMIKLRKFVKRKSREDAKVMPLFVYRYSPLLHMRRSAVDAAVVVVDAGDEPCPFVAGAAVV